MKTEELRRILLSRITEYEWERLKQNNGTLRIGEFNRETILRMKVKESSLYGTVPDEFTEGLYGTLKDYLEQYMGDCPEGHKWVLIACIYLVCIERIPMHPQDKTHWVRRGKDYVCPCHGGEKSVCAYCVCKKDGENMLTKENTVILACSSFRLHVDAAQERMGTDFKVIELDRDNHTYPEKMKTCIQEALDALPFSVENVLAAFGYCGGSFDGIRAERRIVIPHMDDCITILLHTDDTPHINLKEKGHMYIRDSDLGQYSIKSMKDTLCRQYGMEFGTSIFGSYFQNYTNVDIIDTGAYDCYSETFAAEAQENADLIRCTLDYVQGSNTVLEKLVAGRWDGQFKVFEKGTVINGREFCGI